MSKEEDISSDVDQIHMFILLHTTTIDAVEGFNDGAMY